MSAIGYENKWAVQELLQQARAAIDREDVAEANRLLDLLERELDALIARLPAKTPPWRLR
jgi:hypothetical protein